MNELRGMNEIKEDELQEIKEDDEGVLLLNSLFFRLLFILAILTGEEDDKDVALADEVLHFGTNCPSCNAPCETNMKVTSTLN